MSENGEKFLFFFQSPNNKTFDVQTYSVYRHKELKKPENIQMREAEIRK